MMRPRPILASSGLLAALLALRVPFLDQTLVGEEGCFAYLVVPNGRPETGTGDGILVGRLEGRDVFFPPEHPIPPYRCLQALRRLSGDGMDFDALTMAEKSRRARTPFLAFSAVALALLLTFATSRAAGRGLALALSLVAFVGTAPLLVGGSVQAQVDGAFGVMLVQLVATCLLVASRLGQPASGALSVLAGTLAAMGKNEWALAFLGAIAGGCVTSLVVEKSLRRSIVVHALLLAAGLGVGSLLSYAVDSANYLRGFIVMKRIQETGGQDWLRTFSSRLPFLWPLLPLVVVAGVLAWRRRKFLSSDGFHECVLLLWGLALGFGFTMTSWQGDGFPRYFCPPAFAVLAFSVVLVPELHVPRRVAVALVSSLLLGAVGNAVMLMSAHAGRASITSVPGLRLHQQEEEWGVLLERASRGEPVLTSTSFGYYFPQASFVSDQVEFEEVKRLTGYAGERPRGLR